MSCEVETFLLESIEQVGRPKKTWEVIRDNGLHTYDIAANPKYRDALEARTEALGTAFF